MNLLGFPRGSSSPEDTELVARLRSVCNAVADATHVSAPPLAELHRGAADIRLSVVGRPAHRRPAMVATACGLAAMLLVGILWVGRGPDRIPTLEAFAATLVHPVPGPLPKGFGLDEITADSLTYTSGSRRFTIRPTAVWPAVEEPDIDVRGEREARVTVEAETSEIIWRERTRLYVSISAIGVWTKAELIDLANNTVMISQDAWGTLTARSGFTTIAGSEGLDRFEYPDMPAIDPPSMGGSKRLTRSIIGDLQAGLMIFNDCCYGSPPGSRTRFFGNRNNGRLLLAAHPSDKRIDIVDLKDQLLASLIPVCDPGAPLLCQAVFVDSSLEENDPPREYRARFFNAAGEAVAQEFSR